MEHHKSFKTLLYKPEAARRGVGTNSAAVLINRNKVLVRMKSSCRKLVCEITQGQTWALRGLKSMCDAKHLKYNLLNTT